ncbi:MAG: amino acid adenylation domain-containing protein [Gammaproteobacteria bacterium]|nr:amino acid adenylation domain-containing protein [Gammaproteobacteria bacterium]
MDRQSSASDKKALLARLLLKKKQAYNYPLSYGQQALWFVYQNAPDSPAYNMAWPMELQGSLKSSALQSALQTLVNRHPALRTTIDLVNGEPVQTVHPAGNYHLKEYQALEWSEQQLWPALKTAYEQPFDLAKGPVLRVDIFQTAPQRYIILLTMHHILGDAGSMDILGNELLTLCQAEVSGQKAALPPILANYADFVRDETAMLESSASEKLVRYWRQRLGGESPVLNLTADYPRPAVQNYNGASVPYSFSTQFSQQLNRLARQEKTTLFSLLLTAFQVLLHRYAGQTEIWIGTPASTSRRDSRFAGLVGYFVNPIVLRAVIDPSAKLSFRELLSQTRQTVLEALEHAAYPFPLLVKTLQPRRDPSYAPLFQVMLDFKPANFSLPSIPGLTISPVEMGQMEGQFDLTLNIKEGEQLGGRINYNCDLFRPETIKRMAEHFELLLTAVVNNPDEPAGSLPITPEQEIQQLQAWNDTAADYPKDLTIVKLFERQVQKTPDNIALVFAEQKLTYRRLNEKVNLLANCLLSLKTRKGAVLLSDNPLIAICVERSPEMVIGLLAILKTGGAYVPMDPGYPKDRICYMLEDSAAPVLLTQKRWKTDLALDELEHECIVLCLDDEGEFADQLIENPTVNSHAEDLAYVIYTSGSTGKPKGAMNAHAGIVNRLLWMQETYQIGDQDRVLQKTTFSFDVSVWEFFWPLITGAGLVVAKPEGHKDPVYLASVIAEHAVTVVHFVPSMLQTFINHADMDNCHGLKRVICSGEALGPELVKQFFARFADLKTELHNLYGPTEAAIDVSYWPCRIEEEPFTTVPIGKPVANTQLYVLDANLQIMPVGVPGELHIGGIQVGRGYLNRPELTAEKFIEAELFGKTERVYKTGDLARWLPDGNIEYLGRMDFQVKLRGFRIELGEIESAILQVPGIRETAVIVRETGSEHKQLIAYVAAAEKQDETDTALKLKEHLQQKLPDYMVPAIFMFIEALPLTANGKFDSKALPEPAVRKASYVCARDATELGLARIWEKLFDIAVGVQDDFFDIGGDSLLAMRLIFHIREEFGRTLPLHTLFQSRTIEQLASTLRKDAAPSAWSPMVCLQPKGEKSPLFFAHASGGSAFNYVEIAALMGTERPFYAMHPRGSEPGDSFHDSIEEMAADYVSAMRKIQPKGPYLLAGWSFGGTVIFEMAHLLEQAGETAPLLVMIDTPELGVDFRKDDDVAFLMDRVPYYHGVNVDELESQDSSEAQVAYILKEIKMAGMFRPDIDQEYAQNWFNIYKHHNMLVGPYKPTYTVNSKIIFFKPSEKIPFDVQMGEPIPTYERLAQHGIEVHDAQGNHFNMISPANTPLLIEKMKECIESQFSE